MALSPFLAQGFIGVNGRKTLVMMPFLEYRTGMLTAAFISFLNFERVDYCVVFVWSAHESGNRAKSECILCDGRSLKVIEKVPPK